MKGEKKDNSKVFFRDPKGKKNGTVKYVPPPSLSHQTLTPFQTPPNCQSIIHDYPSTRPYPIRPIFFFSIYIVIPDTKQNKEDLHRRCCLISKMISAYQNKIENARERTRNAAHPESKKRNIKRARTNKNRKKK